MVERVAFQGIKSLADVSVDLGRLTVLVGPNGCGKTTMLDEIARACRMARIEGWAYQEDVTKLEIVGARQNKNRINKNSKFIDWILAVNGKNYNYRISLSGSGLERYSISTDDMSFNLFIDRYKTILFSIQSTGKKIYEEPTYTSTLQSQTQYIFPPQAVTPLRLSLNPDHIARHTTMQGNPLSLQTTGEGLPALLAHLAINEHETYLAIQADLRDVVPHFEKLYLPQLKLDDDRYKGIGYGLNLQMKGAGRIPAEEASEGTLLALGLLTAIHADGLADIVLIDDVDKGLHLGAQYRILKAIRRILERRPGLQVVMTTHSPYLLQEVEASEVRVMGLDAEGCTKIKRLDEHPQYARWRNGMGTGEIWANLGEDWVSGG